MLKVEHAGHTFEAKGSEVLVGKENFVFIGDVLKLESHPDGLLVETEYDRYMIFGAVPAQMYATSLKEAA